MAKDYTFGASPEHLRRLLFAGLKEAESDSSSVEGPGTRIDHYRLLEVIGEGGMGIVYRAEQAEPVRREVALKIIKPGMDSKRVLARFEAEQQALALMEHPHIARVYDAGLAPSGRPYFVMEYVKGIPITEHCDKYRLTVEERLHLFLHVCEAIQHAHQKGIIHRDLKPSNILVVTEGQETAPKVIDFGVARAISQPLTERTFYTEQGQLIGTPAYMSPEQANPANQDIDTRTDIYSLGIVLYELLAGVLPFDPETFRTGGIDNIRKVICEEDPKTPSMRLSKTSVVESGELARRRQTDVRILQRKLRGDIDWIALKAMEKDRTRRYASASELAADIRRHLNNEPVATGPPSTLYRMRKCVRRHQALVAGLVAVLVVLLAGVAGVIIFAIKADRQARAAQAVTDFLGQDLLGSVALQQAMSQQVTIRSVLDAAAARLKGRFTDEPLVEASIRQYLGQTYMELGAYKQAELHLERAHDLRRRQLGDMDVRTLDSMGQLGRLYLLQGTRYKEAEPMLVQALESRRRLLGPDHADTLEAAVWLGQVYAELTKLDEAEQLLTTALESCNRLLGEHNPITLEAMYGLAFLRIVQGRVDDAKPVGFRGWEISRNVLGEGHRLTLDFMNQVAWFEALDNKFDEAELHAKTALEANQRVLGKEHRQTILAMGTLGQVYAIQNKDDLAEPLLIESVSLGGRVLGKSHAWHLFHRYLLGDLRVRQGRYDEAESILLGVLNDGRDVYPDSNVILRVTMVRMDGLYKAWGKPEEAEKWLTRWRRVQPPSEAPASKP